MSYAHCRSRELSYLVSSCLHFISTAADSLDFVLIVSRWRIEWQYVFRSLTIADSVCKTHYNTPQRPFYKWLQIFLTWFRPHSITPIQTKFEIKWKCKLYLDDCSSCSLSTTEHVENRVEFGVGSCRPLQFLLYCTLWSFLFLNQFSVGCISGHQCRQVLKVGNKRSDKLHYIRL